MGKVYARLIIDTSLLNEDYVLARAYKEGEF